MKILIVNTYDTFGGAARAAYRLFLGLKKYNIDVEMLVQKKFSNDDDILEFGNKTLDYDELLCQNYPSKSKVLFSSSIKNNLKLVEYINKSDASIVNLHWIASSFLSTEDLARIEKPIIWTLHDMWAFTGGCHIDEYCGLFEDSCSRCIVLKSDKPHDLSSINFNRKMEVYTQVKDMYIVGASSWISRCAQKSTLLKNHKTINIPNPIDIEIFKPYEKERAKADLRIDTDKKIILFGAMDATSDPNKGYRYLLRALELLDKRKHTLVVFGNRSPVTNLDVVSLGHINSDEALSKIYSCADVMVVPSIQENLANSIIEALSCETPVVAFDIGGNSDMIEHKTNGYLAKPFDSKDLANGIKWVLGNKEYNKLYQNSRLKVLQTFSEEIVIPKYINIYENIISNVKEIKSSYREDKELTLTSLLINSFDNFLDNRKSIDFSREFSVLYNQILKIDENIVIYGNGTVGKTIQALIPDKVVGFVDMADEKNHPKNLLNMKYDKILISVLGREEEIIKYLTEILNIDREKIITLELKNE